MAKANVETEDFFDEPTTQNASAMSMMGIAPELQPKVEFRLTPQKRTVSKHIFEKDGDGFKLVIKEFVVDGFLMRCMKGHSQFVTAEQLKERKLDRHVRVYRGDGDDPVSVVPLTIPVKATAKEAH